MAILKKFNEDFWRCPECSNAYFFPRKVVRVEKDLYNEGYSFEEKPAIVLEQNYILECSECGKKLTREELIEHEKNK